jgi:nucleoside-diphosphate-sugar epimerase
MATIAVTEGSGKAGRVVVRDLQAHGHRVLNIDLVPSPESPKPEAEIPLLRAEVTDCGQTLEALSGGQTLAGVRRSSTGRPFPRPPTPPRTRCSGPTSTSTYTVFSAARLGLPRVVSASSETTLRLPYVRQPDYAPVDEAHVYPETSYALSKILGEEMARQSHRWHGTTLIGLRFSNIMVRSDYERFPTFWNDPHRRKWNLWGYVDESHVAQSVRLALEADVDGADSFIIAAADTVMKRPSRELMSEVFPGVPLAEHVSGHDTLLDIRKAREVLGYSPTFSWRELF